MLSGLFVNEASSLMVKVSDSIAWVKLLGNRKRALKVE